MRFFAIFLAMWLMVPFAVAAPAPPPVAVVLDLDGPINPVTARYVVNGLRDADVAGAVVVVLRLDTPGGLDTAMRDIIRAILGSPVPVVVYVAPSGSRAASAGMYMVMAAHVAAMAPNTTIGAAHPVGAGGEEIKGAMADKVTNDAAAYARGLAAQRGRNAQWAEEAVRRSVSLVAHEAKRRGVIDLVAADLPDLLKAVDGRTVATAGGLRTLRTRAAVARTTPMTGIERFLLAISQPAMALILLNIGMLGVFLELQNPGAVLPGVVGVIGLLLGFYALGMLPVSGVGVALLGFGMLLLFAELFVPSYGILSVGGIGALILGSLLLFQPDAPGVTPPWYVLGTISGTAGALVLAALSFGLRAQGRPVQAGREELLGRTAVARTPLAPTGVVFVEGELWRADTRGSGPVAPGESVVVDGVDGLTLHVRRPGGPPPGSPTSS